MKLAEAWRLSRQPYREVVYRSLAEEKGLMWWGAFGKSQSGKDAQSDLELTNRALRIARFDKILVSIFNVVVSISPFAVSFLGVASSGLAGSIALSLAATFGFTILYAIQTLSSFVSAESSVLLSTLPIEKDAFSLITLFSFVRSVDYMVLGSILSQILVVAFLTGSPLAVLIMFLASAINELFAVTIALWFSRLFQKNLLLGGKSKTNTILRLVFILMWGLLLVGVGFLFSIPWYIVPNLENILLGAGQASNLLMGLLYPFSTGILVASVTYSKMALTAVLTASISMAMYAVLAILAGRWSLGTVKNMSQGSVMRIARRTANDFSVKIRRPLFGYILKDLKVASRNPATAFFFALPVLETVIITLLISNLEKLRTAMILDATLMGAIFALFMPLALLTAEGKGLEYTKTLPINSQKLVTSKTLISTGTYILVPLALIGLSVIKPLIAPSSLLLPFLTIMSVTAACIFEIKIFLRATAKGKIAAIINDLEKLVVGTLTVLVPMIVYGIAFLLSFNHVLSILVMGATALTELSMAIFLLRSS